MCPVSTSGQRLMRADSIKPAEAASFERSYQGTADQVGQVRKDLGSVVEGCPFADDFVLLASEVSTNAVVHSRSGLPGGVFTVRAEVRPDEYVWLEVEDQGGPWVDKGPDDEHGRGLALVDALAGEDNWLIDAGATPGTRVVWVWLDWAGQS